jgi:hypothetical protein
MVILSKVGNVFTTMRALIFLLVFFSLLVSCGVAPGEPAMPLPGEGAAVNTLSPDLCAIVNDPDGDKMQVRFFGRIRTDSGEKKFTVIILPDTQHYTQEPKSSYGGGIEMFYAQTKWIAENRQSRNIVYVGHLGDCVQNGDDPPVGDKESEWKKAGFAISNLENPQLTGLPEGIPFGICVGNHDETPNGSATGTTTYYNKYFGADHFNNRSYYGGHYGSNNNNYYELFNASGIKFLVISMQYDQSPAFLSNGVLDWAEGLVKTYSDRKVIVLTHYVINEDKTFSPQGRAIYERLKSYPNFNLFLGGHRHNTNGEAKRTDVYRGNSVHSMLSDYQARGGGGNGLLRILEFDPEQNKISVKTYSPYTRQYETDADSQFELSFNMLPQIGHLDAVASGTNACYTWPGLLADTRYEWNMETYDGLNLTIGPVWHFMTSHQ